MVVPSPWRLRAMVDGDVGYVVDSWVREACAIVRGPGRQRKLALDGLRRLARVAVASGRVTVACSARSESTILGWACRGEGGELFAAHVRYDMRGRGIGRALMEA